MRPHTRRVTALVFLAALGAAGGSIAQPPHEYASLFGKGGRGAR